jgi:hypothetical protein
MLLERRQHVRVIPDRPLLIRWGESQLRLLLDLSEEGLAVDGFVPESAAEAIPLSFDLPDGRGHIQASAEIAWTNDSDKRAGLRFVDMADTSRQQLREWISTTVYIDVAMAEADPVQVPLFPMNEMDSVDLLPPQATGNEGLIHHRTSPYLMWLVLAVVSLFSGVAFVRHYLGGVGDSWQGKAIMAAGKETATSSPNSVASVKPSSATSTSVPSTLPVDLPGFVLQVGAMKHEDNADALAKTLQKRNLPAFVFQRGSDPFYRVAVGVYSDPGSAARIKDQLKTMGFKVILKHWSPV